tara:strand:- start:268 stop:816 length:549 start_codon:yes stop_codon:yes gene_type:complete
MDTKDREWLSFFEAAAYLKEKTPKKWIESDILRAILDGHLTLVASLPANTSCYGESKAKNEISPTAEQFEKRDETSLEGLVEVPIESNENAKHYIAYLEHGHHEKAIFSEFVRPEINNRYVTLQQGATVFKLSLDAALAKAFDDEPRSSRPAKQKSIFPPGTKLGVRVIDLDAFIETQYSAK